MKTRSNRRYGYFLAVFLVIGFSVAAYMLLNPRTSPEKTADGEKWDDERSRDAVTNESPEEPPGLRPVSSTASTRSAKDAGKATTHPAPEFGFDIGPSLRRPITDSWAVYCQEEYERGGPDPIVKEIRAVLDIARKQQQTGTAEVPVDMNQDGVVDWWVYFQGGTPAFVEKDRYQTGCRDLRVDVRKEPWCPQEYAEWAIEPPIPVSFAESPGVIRATDLFDWATPRDNREGTPGSAEKLAAELLGDLSNDFVGLAKTSADESVAKSLSAYTAKAVELYPRFSEDHRRERYAETLRFPGGWKVENVPYDLDADGQKEIVVAYSPFGVEHIQFCKKEWTNEDDWIATVFFEKGTVVRIDMGAERCLSLNGFWARVSKDARRKIAEKHLLPGYRRFRDKQWYQAMADWRRGSQLASLLGDLPLNAEAAPAGEFLKLCRGVGIRSAAEYWRFTVEGIPAAVLLVTARDLGCRPPFGRFTGLTALAAHYTDSRNYPEALALYHLTLRFAEKRNQTTRQINTLDTMSMIYVQLGNYDRAIDCLFRSLDLESSLGYAVDIVENLSYLVQAKDKTSAMNRAVSMRAHAMAVNRGCKLATIAALYTELGDEEKAGGYLMEAKRVFELAGHKYAEADLETIRARWDFVDGKWQTARERLQRALRLSMDRLSDQKKSEHGLELYRRGNADHVFIVDEPRSYLRVHLASGTHPLSYQANIAGMIAEASLRQALASGDAEPERTQQLDEAFQWQSKSLKWYEEARDTNGILAGRLRLAAIAMYRGQFDDALQLARQVATESAEKTIFETLWRARALQGAVHAACGRTSEAVDAYEQAAKEIESVRQLNRSESARRGLLGSKLAVYEELALLYHFDQKPEAVWHCMERGKARTLLDVLAGEPIQPKGPEVVKVREAQPLLFQRLFGDSTPGPTSSSDSSADYDKYLRTVSDRPGVNEVVSLRVVNPVGLHEVQQALDEGTLLIEYFATRHDLLAAVVSHDQIKTVLIPGYGHAKLREEVGAIRGLFQSPRGSYKERARQLYQDLLAPCLADSGAPRHLCIVPSGALNYLPFQALLSDDGSFLVQKTLVSYAPSASALCFARHRNGELQHQKPCPPLVVAASSATMEFPSLPYGELSGRAVAQLQPNSEILLGEHATETEVKAKLSSAGIFHFEGHADLEPNRPMHSALILAEDSENDGRLEVRELFGLRAPHCQMAVLAACETRMGQWSQGDEMVGLTRAFLRAGIPTVVASIWKIQDKTSAQIMVRFHQLLARPGTSKLEALATAQREFIAGQVAQIELPGWEQTHLAMGSRGPDADAVRGKHVREDEGRPRGPSSGEEASHPYYWAGIELIGDWK